MDFRQRLEQNRHTSANSIAPAEPEEPVSHPYYGTITSHPANCLDLRLPRGVRRAFPYAFVTEISYDLDAGIDILTQRKKITIIGRNLSKLYDHLIAYRVRYIQANIGSDPDEDGLFVKEILIVELD